MKDFLKKYWLWIIGGVFLMITITVLLMIITSKPQEGHFIYQIN